MKSEQPASFEVHCDHCRVTFPVGTRRCLHCGAATHAGRGSAGLRLAAAADPEPVDVELEQELAPRRFVSPTTFVWIALIAAGYLYRACAGQAP